MKIAFISQYNPAENLGGGILLATLSKAEGLAELGNEVTLFCPGDKNQQYLSPQGYRIIEIKSWTWKREKTTGKALLDRYINQDFRTQRFLKNKLIEVNPEYIITTTEGSLGKSALRFAKKNNKKIFFYPHVILSKIDQFVPKENVVGRFMSKYVLVPSTISFINKCTGVIAINQASQTDLKTLGIKVPIKIVPNSINYELFSNIQKTLLKTPVLTYVGLISERKNQKYLIKVLEELGAEVKLILIGSDFDRVYSNELKEYIKLKNLNVEIIGKASQQEISRVLAITTVFVSASVLEVQSLSVLESVSSGTPVVMLENETVQDFERLNGVTILNQSTLPPEFSKEVLKFVKMKPADYDQISLSLKVFAQRFSPLDTAEVMLTILKEF